ncbi:holin [Clostridium botulinum C]|uniref:Holin n=2 Tax=Clostridium botulinum TaxID=1491 RepID=A0A9Q4TL54_CLOBO|nr:phage holin family protein [Clostridium botulinum]EGO87447.1 holin [Clostridium botulinum C str. Stockholm]MCD3194269.1 holin [Clostridium botulinum C]MCD3199102.1 holin [Clostridium botulinum C]MCD3204577.1 holin [Clostridium botulinum C]MCD3209716.1 holin [Clostridium botulinum C]
MNLIKFIPEQLLILVAALYVIGIFLKNSKVKDNIIPWILLVVGITFSLIVDGLNATSILEGVICSFCAIGSNQLYKQAKKGED